MSVNLEQFHQVFFEESYEGLDVMESSLMELDISNIDDETINAIFRCAHSIKGGSATFGFISIAEFTHVLETLLDQVRAGERGLSNEDVNLFLKSVDCMREMLALLQNGDDEYTESARLLKLDFEALLTGSLSAPNSEKTDAVSNSSGVERTWSIDFTPHTKMFESGNDSQRILQELSSLGRIEVNCNLEKLPSLAAIQPTDSYLSWSIQLVTDKSLTEIEDVFSWVEDDCDLSIEEQSASATEAKALGWIIQFQPCPSILASGNEPARIFRTLADFGDLIVIANSQKLPKLKDMQATECSLAWTLELSNCELTIKEVEEVFEWVADDAQIEISRLDTANETTLVVETPETSAAPEVGIASEAPKADQKTSANAVKKATPENSSIRVGIDKIDNLINMVGELVITQSMLGQLGAEYELDRVPKLTEGLNQLEQNTRELQESVMKIRMLPISFAFNRFPRMVRDLGQRLGKTLELEMTGEQTELDKTVMEKIGDPLVHLVRNAVDHGIEMPEERKEKGKNPSGKITLNAFHQSGNVVIEIVDDGKGLDKEKIIAKAVDKGLVSPKEVGFMNDEQVYDLIFQPGFSTAKELSDVSGRGVGMDVVKRNIQALNGVVEISSEIDRGSKITIRLPLTLAILDGQLVRVGNQTFVFPLVSIIESMQCRQDRVNNVGGGCNVFKLRDDYVPIIELYKAFSIEPDSEELDDSLLVVVESDGEKIGIVVDDLLAQQQVVIKSLEQNFKRVVGASGATILGDGTVALILDIPGIISLSSEKMGMDTTMLSQLVAEKNRVTGKLGSRPNSLAS